MEFSYILDDYVYPCVIIFFVLFCREELKRTKSKYKEEVSAPR